MSLEYDVRVETPVALGELLRAAAEVGAEVGLADIGDGLVAVPDLRDHLARRGAATVADEEFLTLRYGEPGVQGPDCVVRTRDGGRMVQLFGFDHGDEDEFEAGRRITVDMGIDRTPPGKMLGAVIAVAAARLTRGVVIDETLDLTGERVSQPDAVLAALRQR